MELYKLPIHYTGRGLVEFTLPEGVFIRTKPEKLKGLAWDEIGKATSYEKIKYEVSPGQEAFRKFMPGQIAYAWAIQEKAGDLWAWFDPVGSLIACVQLKGKPLAVLYEGYDCNDWRDNKPRPKPSKPNAK